MIIFSRRVDAGGTSQVSLGTTVFISLASEADLHRNSCLGTRGHLVSNGRCTARSGQIIVGLKWQRRVGYGRPPKLFLSLDAEMLDRLPGIDGALQPIRQVAHAIPGVAIGVPEPDYP